MSANGETDKKSVAARLVGMAQERYLLGVSEDGEPFGADRTRPHLAMLLRGGRTGLRADLAARYFTETGAAAGGQALTDSTLILEGLAATQPPERLHLRVADHQGTIYIDTGRPDGQVIRIGQGRWTVTNTAPVRFLRTKLTGAMPVPPQDGDVARLWDFVNVAAEDRPVLLAVLVSALVQCDVPHPVLALFAEQGSAKSTTTRMLVDLIDPSPVPLRQAPRDADSWVTAASGSWVVALDNLSAIPPWLSDSLCRAATGDGNVKRALYTDADLAVLKFRRCVIVEWDRRRRGPPRPRGAVGHSGTSAYRSSPPPARGHAATGMANRLYQAFSAGSSTWPPPSISGWKRSPSTSRHAWRTMPAHWRPSTKLWPPMA